MHLVQIFLPLYTNRGDAIPKPTFDAVREELMEQFGGLTAYPRAPAKGLWDDDGEVQRDDIVVYEVMAPQLDRAWWKGYRAKLEKRFVQQELVVRALVIDVL